MAQRLTVYSYHKVGQPPRRTTDPFLYTTPQEFDRQLSELNTTGFKTTTLGKALGNETSERAVVITFDDAFRNVFEHGLEILARHKVPAIQFVVSGSIGKENHWDVEKSDVAEPLMDVAQIKQWIAAGNEIGSHSVTHRNLKKLSANEAREEIVSSKKFLEDTFGVEVRHFCYPFGGWTPEAREIVVKAGYQTACTMDFGTNAPDADRFTLRRIIPFSGSDFTRKIFHRLGRKFGMR